MSDVPTRALSLLQPWAWAVLTQGKDIENRRWPTRFRGPVIIHTGKGYDPEGHEWLVSHGYQVPSGLPRGAFLGEMTITGCRRPTVEETLGTGGNPWAFGPWCFPLEDIFAYPEPILGRGALSFFTVPPEVHEAARKMRGEGW